MHKNQLQELAQKNGYNLPSYACIREGPDHAPKFKATVLFNGETYESPGYFVSLRQAEHAAAEVALRSLSECVHSQSSIAKVLDESGVCKNMLQETAQRAGVPLPNYNTVRSGPGHLPVFTCSVEVAGLQFSGEAARTKKQAEKNAALSAWSALKRHAGRNTSAMDDFAISDEAEQISIARVLTNAYNANSIKSSPAILSRPEDLPAGMYLPTTSSHSMTSAPLYTRNRSTAQQRPNAGPLYTPRHVSTSVNRAAENSSGIGSRLTNSGSFRSREVTIRETIIEGVPSDNSKGSIMGAPPQFPRMNHSSPHIEPPAPAYTRRSHASAVSSRVNGNSDVGSSVPNFPTQPLISQAVPLQPGIGLPSSDSVNGVQSGTSRYTNIAIKPGMAYQPRSMRGGAGGGGASNAQAKPSYPSSSSYAHAQRLDDPNVAAVLDGRMYQSSRSVSSNGAGLLPSPSPADLSGAARWNAPSSRQASSMPYWPSSGSVPAGSSAGFSGNRAPGAGRMTPAVAPQQCRTELDDDDVAAVTEATTRQMLSHLCL
eukprot:TRINITY_DN3591_c0_g1_i1.p1 TRINITY_DN3591_c0_g1~~TRINITY_DN3591_c0_g1_i1.p1  ORF type:complete len:541 (-),score=-45.89 TRINITY_DN3591_c0_g1_i1:505-2127(-)